MTGKDHNKLLSIFFFIIAGLQFLGGIFIFLMYGSVGTMLLSMSHREEEQAVGGIFLVLSVVVSLFVLIFAVFFAFTGWKLYKEQPIGRTLGIVASILSLLSFPLGTALGIYGLWFFLGEEGKRFYSGYGANMRTQPPPSSWR